MVPYNKLRETVASGLSKHLGVPVIRSNQAAPAPDGAYLSYTITTVAGANNGTWQKHDDGIDRLQVRHVWSITSVAPEFEQSMDNAILAREWLEHTGRMWLKDNGVTVQSTTDITNRDNFITVEYQRRNGFDVVFYIYAETADVITETIETVEVTHTVTD